MTVEEIEDNIKLKRVDGGNFGRTKPKFSTCEENVFLAKSNNIIQYNTKTGLVVNEFKGLEHVIVGFDIIKVNSEESLVACSETGEVAIWKLITRFRTALVKLQCSSVNSFHYVSDKHSNDVSKAVISSKHNGKVSVYLADLTNGYLKNLKIKLKGSDVFVSVNPTKFLTIADKNRINFISLEDFNKTNSCKLVSSKKHARKNFTCLECHPEEEIVITGDSDGQIILWHDIFNSNPAKSIYHWHTLPVNCLSFSSSGSYFYSGGNESVFVRWDWENQNKKFLPRLAGFIEQINVSSQSQLVAICTSDNAVKVIDSSFNDVCLIQHLVIGDNYKCGITLDPRTKSLIMNGSVGKLQFYQPQNNNLLYSMDVVGQNKLSNERSFSVINTQITKFDISKSGSWLATVEERIDPEITDIESRIKFWHFDPSRQVFELNTSIEKPHRGTISSMAFQFSSNDLSLKCVTLGTDKKFKVWHKIDVRKVNNIDTTAWNCLSVGFYKDLPCNGLTFSSDGSLMGIGFGAIVTAWMPNTCELKCSLVFPGHKSDIKQLHFGSSNQCHLLVAASHDRLSVWNILTLNMIWTVKIEVDLLLANKLSVFMAAITKSREIFVFSPDSPNPVYSNNKILESSKVMAAAFIPTKLCQDVQSEWYERVEIYLIDSNKELFTIGVDSSSSEEYFDGDNFNDLVDGITTLYEKMTPFKRVSNVSLKQRNHLFQKDVSHRSIKKYLDAPIHTMIPIRLTCNSLIKSFIVQKNSDTK